MRGSGKRGGWGHRSKIRLPDTSSGSTSGNCVIWASNSQCFHFHVNANRIAVKIKHYTWSTSNGARYKANGGGQSFHWYFKLLFSHFSNPILNTIRILKLKKHFICYKQHSYIYSKPMVFPSFGPFFIQDLLNIWTLMKTCCYYLLLLLLPVLHTKTRNFTTLLWS